MVAARIVVAEVERSEAAAEGTEDAIAAAQMQEGGPVGVRSTVLDIDSSHRGDGAVSVAGRGGGRYDSPAVASNEGDRA